MARSCCSLSSWIQPCLKPTPWTFQPQASISPPSLRGIESVLSFAATRQQLYPRSSRPLSPSCHLGPGPNSALSLKAGKPDPAFIPNWWCPEPFWSHPDPELIRTHRELAQNVTKRKKRKKKKDKEQKKKTLHSPYSNELLQKERKQTAVVPLKKCHRAGPRGLTSALANVPGPSPAGQSPRSWAWAVARLHYSSLVGTSHAAGQRAAGTAAGTRLVEGERFFQHNEGG